MQLDLCPKQYAARIFSRDIKSTAESFKSWNTCMDNKTCKIVAIVGIVVASLFVLWIVATVIQCICMGVSCLNALCCCCCRSPPKNRYVEAPQQAYNNPNMYPQQPPMRQVQPSYESNRYQRDNYEYTGYKPSQF